MKPTNESVINENQLKDALTELDLPTDWEELLITVTEITNDKATGLNNAPPNAFKAMTSENLLHLFDFIIKCW